MSDKMLNEEGYPSDPKERAMEQRLEKMLAEMPTAKAPPELRAEIMAELRATGPGMFGRLRHWWAGIGAWRVPLQVAPAAMLVLALVVAHQIFTRGAMRETSSEALIVAATEGPSGLDGVQIAAVPDVDIERAPSLIKLVPDFSMPAEKPDEVAMVPEPPVVEETPTPSEAAVIPEPAPVEIAAAAPEVTPEPAVAPTPEEPALDESELEVIPAVAVEPQAPPEIPPLAPTIVATPVGAGTEQQIQERESAFSIQSERMDETLVNEAPQAPSMTVASVPVDEGTPEGPIHIEAERLSPDEIAAMQQRPSAPANANATATDSNTPGALAFHGATVTADQMIAQRNTSGLATPPRTRSVESLRFETTDPTAVADQARNLIRNLDGHSVARVPATNDRNIWVVSGMMPRYQLDSLRAGMVMLCDAGAAALASELPEFEEPDQIPPAERREIRVEITISRRP